MRRNLLFSLFAFALVFTTNNGVKGQSQRPNIIFILGDDIGYNLLTADGGRVYSTPNLDKMAAEGMRFTRCHSSPLCSPSRFMLLTGKYNFRNYTQWGVLDQSQTTIANLFESAGYVTSCYGKWQLDGGGASARKFGFENYSIAYPLASGLEKNSIYKNPAIYQNDQFLTPDQTINQYGEDIFCDSVLHFIDRNRAAPFFVYYPMVLSHRPFNPTPDDPEFASWNPSNPEDIAYYPSMIKYMDKKIGQVIEKVKSLHIENNTLILFAGDNGSPKPVKEYSDSGVISGEKAKPTENGTHVPLLAYWPGTVPAGAINNDLIDFTDLFPTLTKLAGLHMPAEYGKVDGIDFAAQLSGNPGSPRTWLFNHYNPKLGSIPLTRWAQTNTYKLIQFLGKTKFFNLVADRGEDHPLTDLKLTPAEVEIKLQLQRVLDGYAAQSAPILFSSAVSDISETSAVISATIADDVLSPVKERGTVYSDSIFHTRAFNHPLPEGGTAVAPFAQLRTGLSPQHNYFYRGYAFNGNDTGYSPVQNFYTLSQSVVAASRDFAASPASNSILVKWSPAIFPPAGASNAGYLVIYSPNTPALKAIVNGLPPEEIISSGYWSQTPSAALPALPDTSAVITGLKESTKYNILLIPYTWDGKNTSTYHYFLAGAKSTFSYPGAIEVNIFPNPSATVFTLRVNSNSTEATTIVITDVSGKKIYEKTGKSSDTYTIGNTLRAGVYFVTILQGLNRRTEKIIKGK